MLLSLNLILSGCNGKEDITPKKETATTRSKNTTTKEPQLDSDIKKLPDEKKAIKKAAMEQDKRVAEQQTREVAELNVRLR